MANRDGSGPEGKGPNTGLGLGECKKNIVTKLLKRYKRLGFRRGINNK